MDSGEMDSFTQKLLERTRARQENLDKKITRTGSDKHVSMESNGSRKRPSPLREDNIRKENGVEDRRIRTSSMSEKSPVKKKVSFNTHTDVQEKEAEECKENSSKKSINLNNRLKKLATFHSSDCEVLESPPTKPQRLYPDLTSLIAESSKPMTSTSQTPLKTKGRLASLAATYSQFEDQTFQQPPKSLSSSVNKTSEKSIARNDNNKTTKSNVASFSRVLEKFETPPANSSNTKTKRSQGFVHSPSKSKLEYDFTKNGKSGPKDSVQRSPAKRRSSSTSKNTESGQFKVPAAPPLPINGQTNTSTPQKKQDVKSDAVSPIKKITPNKEVDKRFSPKKATPWLDVQLKSSNSSEAVNQTVASPSKINKRTTDPSVLPLSVRVALFEKANQAEAQAAAASRYITGMTPPKKPPTQLQKRTSNATSSSPSKSVIRKPSIGKATETVHRQLTAHTHDWKKNEIAAKVRSERQKDMHLLLSRWEQASAIMEGEGSGQKNPTSIKSVQRPSRESTTSSELDPMGSFDTDDTASNKSVESIEDESVEEETNEVFESRTSVVARNPPSSSNSECDEADGDMSELLDEALYDQDTSSGSSDKGDSSILVYANNKMKKLQTPTFDGIFKTPVTQTMSEPPPKPPRCYEEVASEEDVEAPLMHSVSFYRRQKQEFRTPPVRTIVRRREVQSPPSPITVENMVSLKEKIQALQDDVNAQQIIIGQSSQALNLCRASVEFLGSAEQVEAERHLLIATHKRQSALNEIQRLKTESALGRGMEAPSASGSLSIKNIRLQLKRDFLKHTDYGRRGEFVHFFLCLVKHGSQVTATQMVSTMENVDSSGVLSFSNLINIHDLDFNFNVAFEVYGLQTLREQVAVDRTKTLNKKDKSRLNLTPLKKHSKSEAKLPGYSVQSPGGPGAVRTSSFDLIGYIYLNLQTLNRKTWVLEKVPFVSPLDSNLLIDIHCSSNCNIEERGFLTMFEDVSGFGAWHRRWCALAGNSLRYWKYPDDETNRKDPIGVINLRQCVTANVSLVARDVCARPHTFMLIVVRQPYDHDVETLICQNFGNYTAIKHLLSADTKEERIMWCNVLNSALSNIRMWDSKALSPFDFNIGGKDQV